MPLGPRAAHVFVDEIRTSDLIVSASLREINDAHGDPSAVSAEARPEWDRLRSATCDVLRVLWGAVLGPTLDVLFLEGRAPSRPWVPLWIGRPLLVFLRSSRDGYVVTDPTAGRIRTLARIPSPLPEVTAEHAVAHELEQVILLADLAREADILMEAATARLEIHVPLQQPLPVERVGPELQRRAAWIAVSLAAGEVDALRDIPAVFGVRATQELDLARRLLIWQVAAVRDPRARPDLSALLAVPVAELARSAAAALRGLHDPDATEDFAALSGHASRQIVRQANARIYPQAH